MAQEDQTQKCSNSISSGGGVIGIGNIVRSSKKQKPKKVPQRGLGVAQLEKIRLEEQQKKDAAAIFPLPSPTTKSSYLSLLIPSFNNHASNHSSSTSSSSSSIPFSTDLSSKKSIFRPPYFVQDVVSTNTVPLTNPTGLSPAVSVRGNVNNVAKLWSSCEFNLEDESSGVDPGLAFRSNLIFPFESNPIWHPPSLMQRGKQNQQPSSSMVNVSSATSSSPSSSVLNFQMEPPSNQSYYVNYTSLWPEEEKMVGMKRPYPFSLDNPPGPSFHCKFPSIVHHPISDESASCCNGGTFNFEPRIPIFREGLSCSISEPNSKKSNKESGVFNGDFLTLAPPTSSKVKHPPSLVNIGYHNGECTQFESLPYQASTEDSIMRGPSLSNEKQPYYSFFPLAMGEIGQATTSMNKCNGGEVGGSVDLNLKL